MEGVSESSGKVFADLDFSAEESEVAQPEIVPACQEGAASSTSLGTAYPGSDPETDPQYRSWRVAQNEAPSTQTRTENVATTLIHIAIFQPSTIC